MRPKVRDDYSIVCASLVWLVNIFKGTKIKMAIINKKKFLTNKTFN